jgi:hypothetical protein
MKRIASVIVACVVIQAVAAVPAHANIWRWISELSGPGPFWIGASAEFRVKCWPAPLPPSKTQGAEAAVIGFKFPCPEEIKTNEYPRFTLTVEGGALYTPHNPIRYVRNGSLVDGEGVWLVPAQAMFYWQPVLGLELGTGGGVFVFEGSQFRAFGVPAIEPVRVDVRPWDMARDPADVSRSTNILRMVTLRAGLVFLPTRITAVRFGGSEADNALNEPHELLFSFGVVIDYGAWRKRK